MSSYRMDSRSQEQFIRDIKVGNERERQAIKLFKTYMERELKIVIDVVENGCDMSGDFIADERKVSTGADYTVNGLALEVKTSVGHNVDIYLKVQQIDAYIRQGASILYVNGFERPSPAFTLWTLEDLKQMKAQLKGETPPNRVNGGKLSYRINALKYEWRTFEGSVKKYERRN